MPRSYIPILIFALVIGAISGVGVWYRIENPFFISGDTEREWAKSRYEETLSETGQPFPSLEELSTFDEPEVTETPGRVSVLIKSDEYEVEETGDLVRQVEGENHVILSDGTKISLLAVAFHIPRPKDVNVHPQSIKYPVAWRDPITMESLTSEELESLGVDPAPFFDRTDQRLLMMTRASKPVLWQEVTLFNSATLTELGGGHSAYLTKNPAEWAIELSPSYASSIEVLLPISYGDGETKSWDFQQAPELEFSNPAVRLLNLFATNGEVRGHSAGREHASFDWKPARNADFYEQSFALFCSEPRIRLGSFKMEERSGKLIPVDGSMALRNYTLSKPLEEIGPITVTAFPETARVLFKLPPFPEMTEYENLFDIPLPKKTIRKHYELQTQLSSILALRLTEFQQAEVSKDEFPFDIGPEQTYADLLLRYQKMLGKPVFVDEGTHEIRYREPRLLARIKAWIESL